MRAGIVYRESSYPGCHPRFGRVAARQDRVDQAPRQPLKNGSAISLPRLAMAAIASIGAMFGNHSIAAPPTPIQNTSPLCETETARKAECRKFADSLAEKHGFPGAVVYVSSPDEEIAVASGSMSLENRQPMKPDTRLFVGSVTKVFTATVILQLVQEGKLSLDSKVKDLLPAETLNKIPNSAESTIQNLLQHTSGIYPGYNLDRYYEICNKIDQDPTYRPTNAEALNLGEGMEPTGKIGEKFNYSNTNYTLLGEIITKVTGKSLAEAFQQRIFDKIGLSDTRFAVPERPPETASGYSKPDNGEDLKDTTPFAISFYSQWAAGGIVSTGKDLSRLMRALFKDNTLLEPKYADLMTQSSFPIRNNVSSGLGIVVVGKDNKQCFWHNGGLKGGYQADVRYTPARDEVIVVLGNRGISAESNLSQIIFDEFAPFDTK